MRIVDVPLKLISEHNIPNPNIELNNLEKFTIHLLVLPELMDLFFHGCRNLIFKNCGKVVFFHKYLAKTLQIEIWLVFVPQEHVFESPALELQVKLDRNQLQVGLHVGLLDLRRLVVVRLL